VTNIIIAYGCEIRDGGNEKSVVRYLNANADTAGTGKWNYPKGTTTHSIAIVYTKAEFAAAIDKADAVVIYDGHSRIGQGPVFGPAGTPTCPDKAGFPKNPWEDNFRMGYDLADIECIDDIIHHGINPSEFTLPASTKNVFASAGLKQILDDAIKVASSKCGTTGAWRSLSACFPKVATTKNCRGDTSLSARHYWRARASGS
jgi:hypothetical protein